MRKRARQADAVATCTRQHISAQAESTQLVQMVQVQVLRASKLKAMDRGGTSDPYVTLQVHP